MELLVLMEAMELLEQVDHQAVAEVPVRQGQMVVMEPLVQVVLMVLLELVGLVGLLEVVEVQDRLVHRVRLVHI
jgi:hypothetical protein